MKVRNEILVLVSSVMCLLFLILWGLHESVFNTFLEHVGDHQLESSISDQSFTRAIKVAFVFAAIAIWFSISAMVFIIHRRVFRPINYATYIVKRLQSGDKNVRMRINGNNEFTQYSNAFNNMMDSIERQQQQLDTTARQLMENEKYTALGELVAGVAHELNTPLGISLTASSYLKELTDEINQSLNNKTLSKNQLNTILEKLIEGTSVVEGNLHKASELITTFKQVAVDQSSAKQRKFDLTRCLQENIFNMNLKHHAHRVNIKLESEDIEMNSFPGPLGQIITNLVNNSVIHGFNNGDEAGDISISAKLIDSDSVCLTYLDNGRGMTEEVLDRIFEPFFTTSEDNAGTGLGMPIIYNIVTNILKGSIEVTSEHQGYSKFVITVPKDL